MAAVVLALGAACAPVALADPAPALSLSSVAVPTNFLPGDGEGGYGYEVRLANLGAASTDGTPITITDTLPAGLSVTKVEFILPYKGAALDAAGSICAEHEQAGAVTVACTVPDELPGSDESSAVLAPSEEWLLQISVSPASLGGPQQLANQLSAQGGGAPSTALTAHNPASFADPPAGFDQFSASLSGEDGQPELRAGSHPFQYTTGFALDTRPAPAGSEATILPAGGDLKDLSIALPPGLLADPHAALRCSAQLFEAAACPDGAAVGLIVIRQLEAPATTLPLPIYDLIPDPGEPALFGFLINGLPFYIHTSLRAGDHGFTASLVNLSQAKRVSAARITLWGNPAAPAHDPLRGHCLSSGEGRRFSLGSCPAGISAAPALRLPTGCNDPLQISVGFDTWRAPGQFHSAGSLAAPPADCEGLEFDPQLQARPTIALADSPSGFHLDLRLPSAAGAGPSGADLRSLVLDLPPGLVLNPAAANGLAACSPAQVGLTSAPGVDPPSFDAAAPECPAAARLGNLQLNTPLLDAPLRGGLYLATPHDNPFGSLLAIYLAIDDPTTGIIVKLAGRLQADPAAGRLHLSFIDAPQIPIEELQVDLLPGPLAALRTPAACGTYTTTSQLTPYSAPQSGPPAAPADSYAIAAAPGATCSPSEAGLPFDPSFAAGTISPQAGAYTPFVLNLSRADATQGLRRLELTLPPGLLPDLSGVPPCPEGSIAAAPTRSGAAEQATPSCPEASRLGTVETGLGAGPRPLYANGAVYLAGPYRGAPFSLLALLPAVTGPFDLGTSTTRIAVRVDPLTAQLRLEADPLPTILHGVPLDLRSLSLLLDRPGFTRNPTGCAPASIQGSLDSPQGAVASLSDRFQLGGCGGLGFRPRIDLQIGGGLGRNAHPTITADLRPRAGDSNLRDLALQLPNGEFIDPARLRQACPRRRFASRSCPPGSRLGWAQAQSPLLEAPLRGRLYLLESDRRLPDLAVDLDGRVHLTLFGHLDSPHARIRASFDSLPDLPLSSLHLVLKGGFRGILVNSKGLCDQKVRSGRVTMTAHNGKIQGLRSRFTASCPVAPPARALRREPRPNVGRRRWRAPSHVAKGDRGQG